ncbi:MAG: class I SAM-dependent methyltransferase [Candidatus Dormiibacterota bacterium]
MSDPLFEDKRLAELYDPLDPDRSDLDAYLGLAEEFGAHSVLDIGCGTGTFACLLALRGHDVTAVDPAAASLEVAQSKPGADRVHWVHGDALALPALQVDLVTMTGNVVQVFLTESEWSAVLRCSRAALRPGGRLAFEVRDPTKEAWREWNRDQTYKCVDVAGVGPVETWIELTEIVGQLVSFRATFVFQNTGDVITSDSTLRFRHRDQLEASLNAADLVLEGIRGAPDRPGLEFVFVAGRGN